MLAKAMGAAVYRNKVKEIGWFPVTFTGEARAQGLFQGIETEATVFHWHGETFDLPRNAVHLASSADCVNQAFRLGDVWYGVQFHLEVTPEMIATWLEEDAKEGDIREVKHPIDPHVNVDRLAQLSSLVFGRWADLVITK
jgi:GMP synthase-like glutamine amidotransferase